MVDKSDGFHFVKGLGLISDTIFDGVYSFRSKTNEIPRRILLLLLESRASNTHASIIIVIICCCGGGGEGHKSLNCVEAR